MDNNSFAHYDNIESLNRVINVNGAQAIFIDGEYYIPTNTDAILLPQNDGHYVINDTGNIFLNDNFSTNVDSNEFVHFIDNTPVEDDNNSNQNQVLFFTDNVETPLEIKDEENSQCTQFAFIDNNELPLKLEGDFINIDSLLDNINNITQLTESIESNGYQYVLQLQNGTEELENNNQYEFLNNLNNIENNNKDTNDGLNTLDVSKVRGRNLLTGQPVTLDSYLEKVRSSNKEITMKNGEDASQKFKRTNQQTALHNLLNKKLTIGKTSNGQRLIGKVIHVGKKEKNISVKTKPTININSFNEQIDEFIPNEMETDVPFTVILDNESNNINIPVKNSDELPIFSQTTKIKQYDNKMNSIGISENTLSYISKTLTNLMFMESVAKKIEEKYLSIKINEKVQDNTKVKLNVFLIGGYMVKEDELVDSKEKWVFKLDENIYKNELGNQLLKYTETMKITISLTQLDGVLQTTKLTLNSYHERCSICFKEFRTISKLKAHLKLTHHIVNSHYQCQICNKLLQNENMFNQHQQCHIEKNEVFSCAKCDKNFSSELKLIKHLLSHESDICSLKCTICGKECGKVSSWKKHMQTHTDEKPFSCTRCYRQFFTLADLNYHSRVHDPHSSYMCNVCNRTFSRYSNLQRHSEIHGAKNSISLHSCSICGCTYNYVSSLTRHIVQNHLSTT